MSKRLEAFKRYGLLGCLNGSGITSENYKDFLCMEWISVKDRLPPYYATYPECEKNWVILKYKYKDHDYNLEHDPRIFVGRRGNYGDADKYESALGDGYVASGIVITHWMPLPSPPKDLDMHFGPTPRDG